MKKRQYLQIISFMLILCTAIASCSSENDDNSGQTSAAAEEVTEAETDRTQNDNLKAADFDGASYDMIISVENYWGDSVHYPEDYNGELLNDTKIAIIMAQEDRFNCVITETVKDYSTVNVTMAKNIYSGDDTYEIIYTRDNTADSFVQQGLLYDYRDIPNIDLTRVYWDQKLLAASTINNRCYFTFSAFDLTYFDRTHCMVFNKEMVRNYNLVDPYELVSSGEWTCDAMAEMMKPVKNDINGDGIYGKDDQWGYLSNAKQVLVNFWTAAGEQTVKKDSDDLLYFGLSDNERFSNIFDKVYSIMWDQGAWYDDSDIYDISTVAIEMFTNGQSLFLNENLIGIKNLRGIELDFGILPHPKYDENQNEYYCRIEAAYKMGCIPVTNTSLELTGTLMEALSCAAYNELIPAYYEKSLKSKFTRDDESEAMLDIIVNNMFFDYGDTWWCDYIRDPIFGSMFKNNDRDLSSKIAKVERVVNERIDASLPAYTN